MVNLSGEGWWQVFIVKGQSSKRDRVDVDCPRSSTGDGN